MAASDAALSDATVDGGQRQFSIARCIEERCDITEKTCLVYEDGVVECIEPSATPARANAPACRLNAGALSFRVGRTPAEDAGVAPNLVACGQRMDCTFAPSGEASCVAPPTRPPSLESPPWSYGEGGLCAGCMGVPCNVYADGAYECNLIPSRSINAVGNTTVDYCKFSGESGALNVGSCVNRRCTNSPACMPGDGCDFDDAGVASCAPDGS